MKKLLLTMLLLTLSVGMFACETDDTPGKGGDTHLVSFNTGGGTSISTITVSDGATVTLPSDPTLEGYTFDGWFTDEDLTNVFDAAQSITADITLYAKWLMDSNVDELVGPGLIEIPDEVPSSPVTITFYAALGGTMMAAVEDIIDDFETQYSNITVNYMDRGTRGNLHNSLEGAIYSNTLPTLYATTVGEIMFFEFLAEQANLKATIPLDDYIYSLNYGIDVDDFVLPFLEENQQYEEAGYFHSFPLFRTTEIVAYNKTVLDAAGITIPTDTPVTWDQLETWSSQADCDYMISYDNPSRFFINSMVMWDAPYTNTDGDLLIDNQTTRDMMSVLSTNLANKTFAIPASFGDYYSSDALIDGDVCLSVTALGGYPYYQPSDDTEIGFVPLVQYDLDHQMAPSFGSNFAISGEATVNEQLAAWLFIKYITSTAVQADFAIKTNTIPLRHSAYTGTSYETLLTNNDPSSPSYLQAQVHRAAHQQLDDMWYEPAFYGPFTDQTVYYNVADIIYALDAGLSVEDALNAFLNEMANYN